MLKKNALNVVGTLLTLSGVVWMAQGMNLLPGRLMRGDPQWILWGAALAAVGLAVLYRTNRRSRA